MAIIFNQYCFIFRISQLRSSGIIIENDFSLKSEPRRGDIFFMVVREFFLFVPFCLDTKSTKKITTHANRLKMYLRNF